MRKLASLRRIDKILPHPNADRLELAMLGGWQLVVPMGKYSEGEIVVFFEIDSFIPLLPELQYLEANCLKTDAIGQKGYAIKTIKIRGEISQGVCSSVEELSGYFGIDSHKIEDYILFSDSENEPYDLTDTLGVTKYSPAGKVLMNGNPIGKWPEGFTRTDQERVQNLDINLIRNRIDRQLSSRNPIRVTEKLEGTSFTAFLNNGKFGVCSTNTNLAYDEDNLYWKVAELYNLENKIRDFIDREDIFPYGEEIEDFAIQGEIVGPKIQGNIYRLEEHKLFLFGFQVKNTGVNNLSLLDMFIHYYGIPQVPELVIDFPKSMEGWLSSAEGPSILNPDTEREGIVVHCPDAGAFSFKVISNKYLIG